MNRATLATIVVIVFAAVAAALLFIRVGGEETAVSPTTVAPVAESTTTGAATTTSSPPAAATTTTMEAAAAYVPVFEETDCRFTAVPDREPRCGDVIVPEDRSDPTGRQVRLHVAIFESDDADAPADPIVYLDGGPGGESLEVLALTPFEDQWGAFLDNRDLILFDQRGVGLSEPTLECSEARNYLLATLDADLPYEEYLEGEIAAYETCEQRLLADGIDLAQYNTVANAADVADLRIALGYDEWNLFGVSYGTRLAQGVMRDHSEGVRSVVLDSTYPPEVQLFSSLAENYDRALGVLFASCEADAACAQTFPDLEQRLFDLTDQLEADPVSTTVRDLTTLERYDALIDGETLLSLVFRGLYSAEVIPSLPQLIADLEVGDTTLGTLLLTNQVITTSFLSDGMYLSVQCNEEVPFSSEDAARQAAAAYPRLELFSASSVGFYEECALWDSGTALPAENEPVTSDLPTLVLAGEFDPITPPQWGRQTAERLPNATFVEFPGVGHAAALSADCPRQVMLDFLDDPATPPDTSCVAGMAPPAFDTGEVEVREIDLVPFEEDIFGVTITGVVPDGWTSVGPGAWARGTGFADQTAVLQQAVPGAGDPELLISLFASQLGFADDPEPNGTYAGGDRTWTLYTGVIDGFPTEVALGASEGLTGIVVLVTSDDEREQLRSDVLLPVLDAFRAAS